MSLLFRAKWTRGLVAIIGAMATASLAGNLVLARGYGAAGAAAVFIVSSALYAALTFAATRRVYLVRFDLTPTLGVLGLLVLALANLAVADPWLYARLGVVFALGAGGLFGWRWGSRLVGDCHTPAVRPIPSEP